MLLLVGVATAQTCFTAINVPEGDKLYWKAITYTEIENNKINNYLNPHPDIIQNTALGSGQQYLIRIDKNCFNNYLLSHKDQTGITSNQINIQKRGLDYYTINTPAEQTYTISKTKPTTTSTRTVKQITTSTIGGINYKALPNTFNDLNNHPEIKKIIDAGLCDADLKITQQLDKIKYEVWNQVTNNHAPTGCNSENIVDCVLAQRTGTPEQITALNMVLNRLCGVPTRIAHGISEAEFDGINLYFRENKKHYWLEYYDGAWYNKEVLPNTITSAPRVENCIDGKDNNNNGLIDCTDPQCSNNYACTSWVITRNFKNTHSTDLTRLPNTLNINDLTLGNEHATITWKDQGLNLRGVNLDTAVIIDPERIQIRHPELNKTATVKINKRINNVYKDNELCTACRPINQTFTIQGIGTYTYTQQTTNNSTTQPVITNPTTNKDSIFTQIKDTYNKITTTGKIIILITLILIIWMWRRRRKRQMMYNRYGG